MATTSEGEFEANPPRTYPKWLLVFSSPVHWPDTQTKQAFARMMVLQMDLDLEYPSSNPCSGMKLPGRP